MDFPLGYTQNCHHSHSRLYMEFSDRRDHGTCSKRTVFNFNWSIFCCFQNTGLFYWTGRVLERTWSCDLNRFRTLLQQLSKKFWLFITDCYNDYFSFWILNRMVISDVRYEDIIITCGLWNVWAGNLDSTKLIKFILLIKNVVLRNFYQISLLRKTRS